jgi:hypothetical protein
VRTDVLEAMCVTGCDRQGVAGAGDDLLAVRLELDGPGDDLELLGLIRVDVGGNAAAGGTVASTSTYSPLVSRDVFRNLIRSPVTGFSIVCPLRITTSSFVRRSSFLTELDVAAPALSRRRSHPACCSGNAGGR